MIVIPVAVAVCPESGPMPVVVDAGIPYASVNMAMTVMDGVMEYGVHGAMRGRHVTRMMSGTYRAIVTAGNGTATTVGSATVAYTRGSAVGTRSATTGGSTYRASAAIATCAGTGAAGAGCGRATTYSAAGTAFAYRTTRRRRCAGSSRTAGRSYAATAGCAHAMAGRAATAYRAARRAGRMAAATTTAYRRRMAAATATAYGGGRMTSTRVTSTTTASATTTLSISRSCTKGYSQDKCCEETTCFHNISFLLRFCYRYIPFFG